MWYGGYNNLRIAKARDQTDRNIRKTYTLLIKKLRNNLLEIINKRKANGLVLTPIQQEFLTAYSDADLDSGDTG